MPTVARQSQSEERPLLLTQQCRWEFSFRVTARLTRRGTGGGIVVTGTGNSNALISQRHHVTFPVNLLVIPYPPDPEVSEESMELSEEERKRLEKLEHELASTDPELNRLLQAGAPGEPGRDAVTTAHGIFALLGAFALVIAGIATNNILLGAVGFLLMMAGAYWFNRKSGNSKRTRGDTPQN